MVEVGGTRWCELVEQCTEVRAVRDNWTLGDAALEIVPMGEDTARTGALEKLKIFAEELGVSYSKLRSCRDVANSWTHANRLACSWRVHHVLMAHQHLIKEGMSVAQAKEAVNGKVQDTKPPDDTPEEDKSYNQSDWPKMSAKITEKVTKRLTDSVDTAEGVLSSDVMRQLQRIKSNAESIRDQDMVETSYRMIIDALTELTSTLINEKRTQSNGHH